MKIYWALDIQDIGNAFGFSVASEKTKHALAQQGVQYSYEAPIALHWGNPILYRPLPGKINVLYTVYESVDLPTEFIECFAAADAILAPSQFCVDTFKRYTNKPVYLVPHGVDTGVYTYKKRSWSPLDPTAGPFIWMWCGAPNPRKGIDFLLDWWRVSGLDGHPGHRLLIKTTGDFPPDVFQALLSVPGARVLRQHYGGVAIKSGNTVVDTRSLPPEGLCALYHQAHCFVFPTRGEGFGLTAAEAAATGLPIIATGYSGHLDFLTKETAYLIQYELAPLPTTRGHQQTMAHPDPKAFCEATLAVYGNYRRAVLVGKRASERIRSRFTWEQTGKTLAGVLRDIAKRYLSLPQTNTI
jgi:glycosyltransferase involved in cell wall biosynthesis